MQTTEPRTASTDPAVATPRRRGSRYLSGLTIGLCLLVLGGLLAGPFGAVLLLTVMVLAAEIVAAGKNA